ncbi:DUF4241 domain-containing protein [Bacillus sp. A015]
MHYILYNFYRRLLVHYLFHRVHLVLEDEFFGYGVNTGMGCFMDAEAARYLQAYEDKRHKEDNDFYLYEEFAEALEQNYKHTWDWLVTRFHDKVDIAMFTTGIGDGMYPSFWGLDENGEPTCLVTDFFIMD